MFWNREKRILTAFLVISMVLLLQVGFPARGTTAIETYGEEGLKEYIAMQNKIEEKSINEPTFWGKEIVYLVLVEKDGFVYNQDKSKAMLDIKKGDTLVAVRFEKEYIGILYNDMKIGYAPKELLRKNEEGKLLGKKIDMRKGATQITFSLGDEVPIYKSPSLTGESIGTMRKSIDYLVTPFSKREYLERNFSDVTWANNMQIVYTYHNVGFVTATWVGHTSVE